MKIPINNFLDTSKDGTIWYDDNNNLYITINEKIIPITNNVVTTNTNNYQLSASFTVPYPISNIATDFYNYIHVLTSNGGENYLYAYSLNGTYNNYINIGSSSSTPASGMAINIINNLNIAFNIALCITSTNQVYGLGFAPSTGYGIGNSSSTGTTPTIAIVTPNGTVAVANYESSNISIFNNINLHSIKTISSSSNILAMTYDANSNIYTSSPSGGLNGFIIYYAPSYSNSNALGSFPPFEYATVLKSFQNIIYALDTNNNALLIFNANISTSNVYTLDYTTTDVIVDPVSSNIIITSNDTCYIYNSSMSLMTSFNLPTTGTYKMAITANYLILANTSNNTVYIYTYPQANILSPYILNDFYYKTGNNFYPVNGTSSGTILVSNPVNSSFYKKYILYFSNYENTTTTAQTISTNFSSIGGVTSNTTGMSVTFSNNILTLPTSMSATASGIIVIEGY